MGKSNQELSTLPEKEPDRLDVYRRHFLEDEQLDDRHHSYLLQMERAKSLLTTGISLGHSCKIVMDDFGVNRSQGYRIIRDSIDLFGDITKVKKDGMRYIMYENFMMASHLAMKNEDHGGMIRALENASKIYGLFSDTLDEYDAESFTFPVQINFTQNVNVLKVEK